MRDQLLGFLNRKEIEFGLGRLEPTDFGPAPITPNSTATPKSL
jgi:hypothetical protein